MKKSILLYLSLAIFAFILMGCDEEDVSMVAYNAELKGSCIKFEDAINEYYEEDCLGEDGAMECDFSYVFLDKLTDGIEVTIKAGKNEDIIELDDYYDDGLYFLGEGPNTGFLVGVVFYAISENPEAAVYVICVISDDIPNGKDGTKALSNITFCFGEGITVQEFLLEEPMDFYPFARGNSEVVEEIMGAYYPD